MLWFILSILTAVAVASHDAWVKRFFSHLSVYEMSAYPLVYSFPVFAVALLFIPLPVLDRVFYWSFLASLPLNGVAIMMYIAAIRTSPLSLTLPYLAFTPTFIIATGYLFLDEMPNLWGVFGILITCIGSYVLNIEAGRKSIWDPIKAVFKEKGSWMMLVVAFIFSFGAVIGKMAIIHSSVLFFQISFFACFDLFMLALMRLFRKIRIATFRRAPFQGIVAGGLLCAHVFFHGFAISLTKAAYMISVKRLSIVFGMIYGRLIFKESYILLRLLGAVLMISGAVIITLKGG
jgi:drug/metabolite transporter (DMT)-like permease